MSSVRNIGAARPSCSRHPPRAATLSWSVRRRFNCLGRTGMVVSWPSKQGGGEPDGRQNRNRFTSMTATQQCPGLWLSGPKDRHCRWASRSWPALATPFSCLRRRYAQTLVVGHLTICSDSTQRYRLPPRPTSTSACSRTRVSGPTWRFFQTGCSISIRMSPVLSRNV